jgi:hypothetical protein
MRDTLEKLLKLIESANAEGKYRHIELQMCKDGSGEIVGTYPATCGCCPPDTNVEIWWDTLDQLEEKLNGV